MPSLFKKNNSWLKKSYQELAAARDLADDVLKANPIYVHRPQIHAADHHVIWLANSLGLFKQKQARLAEKYEPTLEEIKFYLQKLDYIGNTKTGKFFSFLKDRPKKSVELQFLGYQFGHYSAGIDYAKFGPDLPKCINFLRNNAEKINSLLDRIFAEDDKSMVSDGKILWLNLDKELVGVNYQKIDARQLSRRNSFDNYEDYLNGQSISKG